MKKIKAFIAAHPAWCLVGILVVAIFLTSVVKAFAGTKTILPFGLATPYLYKQTAGSTSPTDTGTYYLAMPTLSANDTAVGLAATQTLTNKTLTSPTVTGATMTTVDINSGSIDGTTIGAASAAAGTFTTGTITTADINGGAIDGTAIGGSTPAAGAFTTLGATGAATLSGAVTGDGGDVLGGYLTGVSDKSASYTPTIAQSGYTFTNTAATGEITYNLPDAAAGLEYCVANSDSGSLTLTVDPQAADQILGLTNAAGNKVSIATVGGSLCLLAIDSTNWVVVGYYGTWLDRD